MRTVIPMFRLAALLGALALAGCGLETPENTGAIAMGPISSTPLRTVAAGAAKAGPLGATAPAASTGGLEAFMLFGAWVSGAGISAPVGWDLTFEAIILGNLEPIVDGIPAGAGRTVTLTIRMADNASVLDPIYANSVVLWRGSAGGITIEPGAAAQVEVNMPLTGACPYTDPVACQSW